MADNSKFLAGIVVGAAAGAAIALLLNSDSGKKALSDLKEMAGKAFRDWKDAGMEAAEEAETAV